jgi:allophanate hydrolase
MDMQTLPFTLKSLHEAYHNGTSVDDVIAEVKRRITNAQDNPIWIYQLNDAELAPYLKRLAALSIDDLPLYGVPFAIKDNIDLAGVPTTAACPDFAYMPDSSAFVVQCLIDAGAIPIGKTNLDQLATGLVGTRSPHGAVQNAFDPLLISGGSSAGSAVSVALGQVSFSLGTDTAGSGRVPAALNNLIGYKPSCGLLSTSGVVPACRTIDCVSVFALNLVDTAAIASVVDVFDPADAYARTDRQQVDGDVKIVAIPRADQLKFFGNEDYQVLFNECIARISDQFETREVDISPLLDAAKLLYEGAWVAERYHAAKDLIEQHPESLREEFLAVVGHGNQLSAVDYFDGAYRLAAYKRIAEQMFECFDALLLPTVGTHYSLAEVAAEPVLRNSDNGAYTNFVNLLDMSALAIPAGFTRAGLPFGVTLIANALHDQQLLRLASRLLATQPRSIGALGVTMREAGFETAVDAATETIAEIPTGSLSETQSETMPVAVCGAHLSGMPLNGQLIERAATLREATHTAACYRLFALPGGPPKRPGMMRTNEGVSIEVEVYDVPLIHVGSFLSGIPQPLGLGQIELLSGEWVTGFICEPCGIGGAVDVSHFGGWRGYIASL